MTAAPLPFVLTLVAALAAGVVAGLVWARRRLLMVSVSGDSMRPTYRSGDRVLVRRVPAGRVRREDVVVADVSGVLAKRAAALGPSRVAVAPRTGYVVKRVAALPGDPVPARVPRTAGETAVPRGAFVLLGDNAGHSTDSRHFGYVPATGLVGKVVRVLPARAAGGRRR
ncbi:S26 family signal peptidase [Microbispora sp. H13382]|uniref:S26 family signal peptidase n=1 Tax=Microbispora sp. H13382 TaxID=2729112 RepID=UPI0015FF81EE|nr:S26 family signal peptidase [Microbispora sp. H13382]